MKILIIKTSSLGDLIHVFPVVAAIKKKTPHAQIDWVVEAPFSELIEAHPHIHRVIKIQTKKWRRNFFSLSAWQEIRNSCHFLREEHYDAVLDLQGNVKSALCTALAKAPLKIGFGWKTVSEWPNYFFTNRQYNPPKGHNIRQDYLFVAQDICDNEKMEDGVLLNLKDTEKNSLEVLLKHPLLNDRYRVLVCPGSQWKNKQLTTQSIQDFLKILEEEKGKNCCFLFTWGSPQEKLTCEFLQQEFPFNSFVLDKLAVPLLQNLMQKMDLVFAMDSLPLHLAGTTNTSTHSVFGASSAKKYKPLGDQHLAVQGVCPYGRTFEKRCPILRTCPTGACIHHLSGRQVAESLAVWKHLN